MIRVNDLELSQSENNSNSQNENENENDTLKEGEFGTSKMLQMSQLVQVEIPLKENEGIL